MKIICQIGVVFAVCWVSQLIEAALPFPFPASVIGMILLLLLLASGLLRVEHIQEKADFLLANMAFFFLPAGVSIMNYFDLLRSSAVALVVSLTLIVTVVSSKLLGCLLPIAASRLGLDPAVMASPLITTIADAVSLLVYFRIAVLLLAI